MTEKLLAIWRLAVALLLYPLALTALIYVWWSGRPVIWAVGIMIAVLSIDRTWLFLIRRLFSMRPK